MYTMTYGEFNRYNPDYDIVYRPSGREDYLFLLLKTPMKVYLGNELTITKENACLLYTPMVPQHYQAVGRFRNSYLHFSGPKNPGEEYGIPANQIFYPENYEEIDAYIRRLQQEYYSNAPFHGEFIHHLLSQMFISIARSLSQPTNPGEVPENLYPQFRKLRIDMLTNCQENWTIDRLCKIINLEKSQFYVYYRHFFATTPKLDLLQSRLEKAKNLLSNEAVPIKEVALLCGFHNLEHFTRYFKKHCDCAPGKWRESIRHSMQAQKESPLLTEK